MGILPAPTKSGSSIPGWLSLTVLALLCTLKKESPHDVPCQSHRTSQPLLGWQDTMLVCPILYSYHDPRPGSGSWSCISHSWQQHPTSFVWMLRESRLRVAQAATFLNVSSATLCYSSSASPVSEHVSFLKIIKYLFMDVQVAHS